MSWFEKAELVVVCIIMGLAWGRCGMAKADQTEIPSYSSARRIFYQHLYPEGGWTLYCGVDWPAEEVDLNVEHVYAASWVADAFGCTSREQCRRDNERFNRAEGDLHNLYAAVAEANRVRSNYPFGRSEATHWAEPIVHGCETTVEDRLRVTGQQPPTVVTPRPIARGNIARAIFYMVTEYGLPLPPDAAVLLRWHLADPPSAHERRRNDTIEGLQGTRNPWID